MNTLINLYVGHVPLYYHFLILQTHSKQSKMRPYIPTYTYCTVCRHTHICQERDAGKRQLIMYCNSSLKFVYFQGRAALNVCAAAAAALAHHELCGPAPLRGC